jgi:hypothetical protein
MSEGQNRERSENIQELPIGKNDPDSNREASQVRDVQQETKNENKEATN